MTCTEILPTYGADHPAFPGHFPGRPIVPGVLLLDAVLQRLCLVRGLDEGHCRIVNTKFISPVEPGQSLQLSHSTDATGQWHFRLHTVDGARLVASGQVHSMTEPPRRVASP
ncbi:beta-hydroxyacyl-ACP dehydratase [Thiomonas intermedia]|uniref:beta-hydroxyacyl-ACP dehydratase n=1 Tax=Thiomonas intermedia TaxID=926 RepID=UPI0012AB30F5|nr:beta-hydroxyacyl-ACP dehydratase [Thiomonas intermedia]